MQNLFKGPQLWSLRVKKMNIEVIIKIPKMDVKNLMQEIAEVMKYGKIECSVLMDIYTELQYLIW